MLRDNAEIQLSYIFRPKTINKAWHHMYKHSRELHKEHLFDQGIIALLLLYGLTAYMMYCFCW